MKAIKKPIPIDFFEVTEHHPIKLMEWVDSFGDKYNDHFVFDSRAGKSIVKTLEGWSYHVTLNDVVIRGVEGEYYPCKKEIFYKTYDILEPSDDTSV